MGNIFYRRKGYQRLTAVNDPGSPLDLSLEPSQEKERNGLIKHISPPIRRQLNKLLESPEKKVKLNILLEELAAKVAINYNDDEFKDIQAAMHTILERVVARVNERGVFSICRIQLCGSMAEKTAVWKDDCVPLEFDFLAVLKNSVEQLCGFHFDCAGCVKLEKLPFSLEEFNKYYPFLARCRFYETIDLFRLFMREVFLGLTFCNCFHCNFEDEMFMCDWRFSYKITRKNDYYHCSQCTVYMPTGKLSLDVTLLSGEAISNLRFWWTSKAKSLLSHNLIGESEPIQNLLINVDFLPALEGKTPGNQNEHDFFLVPKHCCVKGRRCFPFLVPRWRKSRCLAEINSFVSEVSEKHKICYQVMKYLNTFFCTSVNNYFIKTIVLRHNRECSDSTADYVACMLMIFDELHYAYTSGELKSFDSAMNIGIHDLDQSKAIDFILRTFYTIKDTDCLETFLMSTRLLMQKK